MCGCDHGDWGAGSLARGSWSVRHTQDRGQEPGWGEGPGPAPSLPGPSTPVLCALHLQTSPPQGWTVVDSDDGTLCLQTLLFCEVWGGAGWATAASVHSICPSQSQREQGIHEQGRTQSPSTGQDISGFW